MPEHQIHWTALPRRAEATHVELDVFVSPRLGTDALAPAYELGEFPELLTWTERVQAGELSFDVVFDGEPPRAATIIPPDPGALDEELWKHLFPPATPVRPWSFRDHGNRNIRSYPLRWIVGYLRGVYRHAGGEGAALPPAKTLESILPAGDVVDTRVPEEREPATPHPLPGGGGEPQGCLGAILAPLCRLLRPICRPLRRLWRRLRALLGLGGAGGGEAKPSTEPGKPLPGSVEYRYRPPAPRPDDPFAGIDAAIAANKAMPPYVAKVSDLETELDDYPIGEAFAQVMRFYDRDEVDGGLPPAPTGAPEWDFHRRLGALGDYPELMRRLGLVIRLRVPRPAATPVSVRVVPTLGGAARPGVDITPATACTLEGSRFHATPRDGSDLVRGMLDLGGTDDRLSSTERAFDLVQVDADGAAMKAIVAAASLRRSWALSLLELGYADFDEEPEPLPATRTAGIAVVRTDRAWGLKQRLETISLHAQAQGAELLYADEVVRGYEVWVQREGGGWLSLCLREGAYRPVDETGKLVGKVREIEDRGYVKRSGATSKDGNSDLYLHEAIVRWTGWSLVAPLPGKTIAADGEVAPALSKEGGMRLETRFAPVAGSLPRLRFGDEYRIAMAWVDLAGQPLEQLRDGPDGPGEEARASEPVRYRRFEPLPPPSVLPFGPYRPGSSLERLVVRSDFDRDPAQWLAEVAPKPKYTEHDERRLFPPKTSQLMAERHGKFDDAVGGLPGQVAAGFDLAKREQGTFLHPAVKPFGKPKKIGDGVVNRDRDAILVAPYLPDPLAAGIVLRDVPNLTVAGGVDGQPLGVVTVPGVANPVLRIPFDGDWPDLRSLRIRASGENPDAAPHWDAAKRLLTIHLPKATEATLLYSCYLEPKALKKMGAWDWIDDGVEGGKLREQARWSIHWLLCPWREITLVHAVQRPLAEPRLEPDAFVSREAGETTAGFGGSAAVELASSGRVDLEASWKDWDDDVSHGAGVVKRARTANLGNWTPAEGGAMPLQRHEFGDTRHRVLECRLRASSRFREYLPVAAELPGGDGLELTRSGPVRVLSVPASAPPDPPRISHAVPAFGWRLDAGPAAGGVLGAGETLRRRRLGGGLRVFLERPWYSSGEGERLAAVVPGPDSVPRTLLSRVGIDPTVGESPSPRTRELEAAMFDGAEIHEAIQLSEQAGRVAIASYEPVFDEDRGLWACDVALEMSQLPWGEWPFVRLALARHQPEALARARLSKVVLAQWAQLAPDRSLAVTRTVADSVEVELRGRGRTGPEPNRLVVAFEVAEVADPDELDWRPVGGGDPVELDAQLWLDSVKPEPSVDSEDLVWKKDVAIPNIGPAAALRLAVRELERRPGEGEVGRGAFRITYADDVRLR
jgi:hypothetical protein